MKTVTPMGGLKPRHAGNARSVKLAFTRGAAGAAHGLGGGKTKSYRKQIEEAATISQWGEIVDEPSLLPVITAYLRAALLSAEPILKKKPAAQAAEMRSQITVEAIDQVLNQRSSSSSSSSSPPPRADPNETYEETYEETEAPPSQTTAGKAQVRGHLARVAGDAAETRREDVKEFLRAEKRNAELAEAKAITGRSPGDAAVKRIGLILETLPAAAQRFLTGMVTKWPTVFTLNPSWVGRITRDVRAAHLYPPRGSNPQEFLDSVIEDLAEMLAKEEDRESHSSSASRMRSVGRRRGALQRSPIAQPGGIDFDLYEETRAGFVHPKSSDRTAPGYHTYSGGPYVDNTYAIDYDASATSLSAPMPHTNYATPEQRLQAAEAVSAARSKARKIRRKKACGSCGRSGGACPTGGACPAPVRLGGRSGKSNNSGSGLRRGIR